MQRERFIDKGAHQVSEFASVSQFLNVTQVPAGVSTIHADDVPIDLLVHPAASETTIVFFHGAIESHFTLPVLSGLGISGGLGANRVFVSDPSLVLDDELMLSWYAGNVHQPDLQHTLTVILKKVAASLGSQRVVFFGGSGGGFAALYFASHFRNSLALVFNPQTNIAKYKQRPVSDFVTKAFNVDADQCDPLSQLPLEVVSDLCHLYSTSRNTQIAYMQNLNDDAHVRSHLGPFLATMHAETKVLLLTERWNDGHSPPPKELLSQVLNLSVTSSNFAKDFSELGFKNMTGAQLGEAGIVTEQCTLTYEGGVNP